MSDEENVTSGYVDVTPQHTPPKYLIVKNGEVLHTTDTPMGANLHAQEEATKEPGAFVDIYHHAYATCARIDPDA